MPIDHPAVAPLKAQFPQVKFRGAAFRGQVQLIIPQEVVYETLHFLKNEPSLRYDLLADLTAVDYLNHPGQMPDRFALVYNMASVALGSPRLFLRVLLNEPNLTVASAVPLYAGAEPLEREVFDMFGISFSDHPDLRRILTWDGFKAHPLRKDYPVTGQGERENYPIVTRDSA